VLSLRDRDVIVGGTLVMGVVNASPESFSDAGRYDSLELQLRLADALVRDGADAIDVGGQSAITGRAAVPADEEARRVTPVIARLRARHPHVLISVDTYKPAVAEAAIAAGADIVNDVSGLRDPDLASVCAQTRTALVIMHTRARPLQRLPDGFPTTDPAGDVRAFLDERMQVARDAGLRRESLILDPGPDFGKTPAQTVTVLRALDQVRSFGRPVLLALSRKDFLGAIVERRPRGRDAATVAALTWLAAAGGNIARVHDVQAACDAVRVVDVLSGRRQLPADYRLPDDLRHEPTGRPG
jgi:dihydropteroate synthase